MLALLFGGRTSQYKSVPSPREREVLKQIVKGLTDPQIGRELGIKSGTVSLHVCSLLRKFNVSDRITLIHKASTQNQVTIPRSSTDGYASLTPREKAVAALAAEGCSNREIAEKLSIKKSTASCYMHRILRTLGLKKRTELVPIMSHLDIEG